MDEDAANPGGGPDEGDPRTEAWYLAGLELVVGIVVTVFGGWVAFFPASCLSCGATDWPLPVWPDVIPVFAFLGMLAGLAWMIRIYRGPRDEPPPWRYRAR